MSEEYTPAEQPEAPGAPEAADAPEPAGVAEPVSGPSAGEAWDDVVRQMSVLGDAIGTWAKAAYQDPDFQRHAGEVKATLGEMGTKIGETVDAAAASDIGQKVTHSAEQVGGAISEGADKFTQAAAPHVASAFSAISGAFSKAASKVDEATKREEPAPAPPVPPIPPRTPEE